MFIHVLSTVESMPRSLSRYVLYIIIECLHGIALIVSAIYLQRTPFSLTHNYIQQVQYKLQQNTVTQAIITLLAIHVKFDTLQGARRVAHTTHTHVIMYAKWRPWLIAYY